MSAPVASHDEIPLYTVQAVADRLGVPTATLRSWTRRYGIGPRNHRPGRHRRYTEHDVAVLARMHEMIGRGVSPADAARAAAATAGTADTAAVLAAAFALDSVTTEQVIEQGIREHGVAGAWTSVIRPAFDRLDGVQAADGGCMDVEHLLSRAAVQALQRVALQQGRAPAPRILVACCDGEWHTLGVEALTAALAQRGDPPLMLGASVPAECVLDAADRLSSVKVVVLWAQQPATADSAAVRTISGRGIQVMVAGPGWSGIRLPRGVGRLESLDAALERLGDVP